MYPCTGRPRGLFQYKNRATGYASTAGKYAAAFALASRLYARSDPAFADTLRRRAEAAYALGVAHHGACQTAPGRAPSFYEEDSWADDMELGAAELHALTGERRYLLDAARYARQEPVTPWMGADTANHYQWFPWLNAGHHALWRTGGRAERAQAAVDWLFGANPWGTSMVVGYPRGGVWARDPHSAVAPRFGPEALTGGLLDGPVYRSIYGNLRGIALHHPDEYARFNTGAVVYHDDLGDYSTNEPIMDGTASLTYLLAMLGDAASR